MFYLASQYTGQNHDSGQVAIKKIYIDSIYTVGPTTRFVVGPKGY